MGVFCVKVVGIQNVDREVFMSLLFEVVKIHPKAVIPTKIDGNLGFDLHCVSDNEFTTDKKQYILSAGSGNHNRKLFHTGLTMAIPEGCGVVLRDRSGLASKHGIHVLAGVIDSSYRGEWCICLINLGQYNYEFTEGDRICQAIVVPEYRIKFTEVEKLSETLRGEKGFGSSGN
jgi:deoxyuridine 5'-triphosphate nucleotidohydrolase